MIEADEPSTDWSSSRMVSRGGSVLAPPGIAMVAPPEVPRNAQTGKVQAALLQGDGGCSAAQK